MNKKKRAIMKKSRNVQNNSFSNEDMRRILLEFCQFVLNRKAADLREDLHNFLVLKTLVYSDGLLKDEIPGEMATIFHIPLISENLITSTLKRLESEGSVIQKEGRYFVTQEVIQANNEAYEKVRKLYDKVFEKMTQSIELTRSIPLNFQEKQTVFQAFQHFLGAFFKKYGFRYANAVCRKYQIGNTEFSNLISVEDLLVLLEQSVALIEMENLRQAAKITFEKFMHDPEPQFIYALSQSYFFLKVLNLDPDCKELQKRSLSRKRIYLDTSFILNLLAIGSPEHEYTRDILDISLKLGVKVFVSLPTLEEVKRYINRSKRRLTALVEKDIGYLREQGVRALKSMIEDLFVSSFFEERKTNPGLDEHAFMARFENIESKLSKEFGIQFDTQERKHIRTLPEFTEFCSAIQRAKLEVNGSRRTLYQRYSELPPKAQLDIAEHDAFHFVLIDQLRKRETPDRLGSNFFFVTFDRTLGQAYLAIQHNYSVPFHFHVSDWFQYIARFSSPDVSEKMAPRIFKELLFSSLFGSMTEQVNPELWKNILGSLLGFDATITDMDEAIRQMEEERIRKVCIKKEEISEPEPRPSQELKAILLELLQELKKDTETQLRLQEQEKERLLQERQIERLQQQQEKLKEELAARDQQVKEYETRLKEKEESLGRLKKMRAAVIKFMGICYWLLMITNFTAVLFGFFLIYKYQLPADNGVFGILFGIFAAILSILYFKKGSEFIKRRAIYTIALLALLFFSLIFISRLLHYVP